MEKLIVSAMIVVLLGCTGETETADSESGVSQTDTTAANQIDESDWWLYSDWDRDADQRLTETEFRRGWERGFSEWDIDDDGSVGSEEAADMFRNFFDRDGDNVVDRQEFDAGAGRWSFEGIEWGRWDRWDADTDAELTETEWRQGWNDHIATEWDATGEGVADDEMRARFWSFFDGDEDGAITLSEWNDQGK